MLAILLSVALIIGVNVALDSALIQFRELAVQASGNIDIIVRSRTGRPFNESALGYVQNTPGVVRSAARISQIANFSLPDGTLTVVYVVGVDSKKDFDYYNPTYTSITGERYLTPGGDEIVVDEKYGFEIGDKVHVRFWNATAGKKIAGEPTGDWMIYGFTVVGIYHPNVALGQTRVSYPWVYIDIRKAQKIFACLGKVDHIIVRVEKIEKTFEIVDSLKAKLGEGFEVSAVKGVLVNRIIQALTGFRQGLQLAVLATFLVATVLTMNTTYMNVHDRVHEIGVLRSIGTYRRQIFWMFFTESLAIGVLGTILGLLAWYPIAMSFQYAISMFYGIPLTELVFQTSNLPAGIYAGLAATFIGGMVPSARACQMSVIRAISPSTQPTGRLRNFRLVVVGGTLIAVGIWFLPILGSISHTIVTAVQTVGLENIVPIPLIVLGLICLIAVIFERGEYILGHALTPILRSSGPLIPRNIRRKMARSAVCLALISLSLSFVVAANGLQLGISVGINQTIRNFLGADIVLQSEENFPRSLANDIAYLGEGKMVQAAAPAMATPMTIYKPGLWKQYNTSVVLVTIDPSTAYKVINMKYTGDTPPGAIWKLNILIHSEHTVILPRQVADSLQLNIGDKTFVFVERTAYYKNWTAYTELAPKKLKIVGITTDNNLQYVFVGGRPLTEACFISYWTYNYLFPDNANQANMIFIKVKPEYQSKLDYVKTRIQSIIGKRAMTILTRDDIAAQVASSLRQVFLLFYIILVFAIVITTVGMATIFIMNVHERRWEIGILRALGMTKRQTARTILGEALFLGLIGYAVGLIVGLQLLQNMVLAMRQTGFPIPLMVDWENLAITLLIATAISLISIAYPVYRTSKINIVEALRQR